MPDLIGQDRDGACASLKAVQLECNPVAAGNDGKGPTGAVLSTNPMAGTPVPIQHIVTVLYRGDIVLRDYAGMDVDQACQELASVGLTCDKRPTGCASQASQTNIVVSQDPAAGQPAQTGDRLTLTFPTEVQVPDLVGSAVAVATNTLITIGLTSTQTDAGNAPPGTPAGFVVNQTPVAPRCITPTQPVALGAYGTVTVPNVAGLSPTDAQNAILQVGLVAVPANNWPTTVLNNVQSQTPAAGSAAAPGTQVTFYYADSAPLSVLRFKAPASWGNGGHSYVLTTDPAQQPAGYSSQSTLGNAYPAATVSGLVPIYRFDCLGCTYRVNHYYSQNPNPPPGGWYPVGVAFYAFTQQQSGTVPLNAMRRGQDEWAYALQGSYEQALFAGAGFVVTFTVCYVWP